MDLNCRRPAQSLCKLRARRFPPPGALLLGLLPLLGFLPGCSSAPKTTTEITSNNETEIPPAVKSEPVTLPDNIMAAQNLLLSGWEESFRQGRSLEGTEPDSALFFRYQALLAHLNPDEIPDGAGSLRSRAEILKSQVATARDSAWMRWQVDLTPPPTPHVIEDPHAQYTIKPEMNARVEEWLTFFTGPSRERFTLWMWRSGIYRARMEEILVEEGVPAELLAVVFIESGFHLTARSRARAVGPWQFIAPTAKRFGLKINRHRDERRDFELATRAAARYLKTLYNLFGDWNLALASYNCGENRVFRQVARQGTNDFWALDLPRETEDYVPEIHAALHILAEPERYGFTAESSPPLTWEEIELPGPVRIADLAAQCGSPVDEVRNLNPAWLRNITPADGGPMKARIPVGASERMAQAPPLSVVSMAEAKNVGGTHKVRKGETLSRIAQRYGVSTSALARANKMTVKSKLRAGRNLKLPDGAEEPLVAENTAKKKSSSAKSKRARNSSSSSGDYTYHVVRQGDSLWSISKKYGMSLAQLNEINNLGRKAVLKPGQKVKVTG